MGGGDLLFLLMFSVDSPSLSSHSLSLMALYLFFVVIGSFSFFVGVFAVLRGFLNSILSLLFRSGLDLALARLIRALS